MPFWRTHRSDVLELVEGLRRGRPLSEGQQQAIAERAQRVAARYTTIRSRSVEY